MAYIIGIILAIIVLIIIGLILRKRVYDTVDYQEGWKMDIMNRNVAQELQKMKSLNLSGEAQVEFEEWKGRWEHIITKKLPDIEEYLFDAETDADKFRFMSAKKTLHESDQAMQSIEASIQEIIQELDQLLKSEESSRQEMDEVEPELAKQRKQLLQSRYKYGKAVSHFEKALDDLEAQFAKYHEHVEQGDYYEAQQIVKEQKAKLDVLKQDISEFPDLYQACKQDLPTQLDALLSGINEMKQDGYHVDQLDMTSDIHNYKQRLTACVEQLDQADLTEARQLVPELNEQITNDYTTLEEEAVAKNYVETKWPNYTDMVEALDKHFVATKQEVESLKQVYYIDDRDMEQYLNLDKAVAKVKRQHEELANDLETDQSHGKLREYLEDAFSQVESAEHDLEMFEQHIKTLRKDELSAKEALADMKQQLQDTMRRLNKSNLPGVPQFVWSLNQKASEKNVHVLEVLQQKPLDMTEVQQALDDAKKAIDQLIEQTDLILDQAYLTEQVIQYANRYRSKNPLLAAELLEAESLFRSYQYELSLEKAAKALEEVDPGAIKRIETIQAEVMG